jgi:hypothetical protein
VLSLAARLRGKGGKVNLTVRQAVSADAETCGRIIYDAFKNIADRHGFPPHFPTKEIAFGRATYCISHPSIFGVVAEADGQVVGSNFLDERVPIRGLGPVTVDPSVQVSRGRAPAHEFRSTATIFAGEASKFVSLVFKPGASSSHADDADGAGRVSGTQRLLHPLGSLLNAAEQQTQARTSGLKL